MPTSMRRKREGTDAPGPGSYIKAEGYSMVKKSFNVAIEAASIPMTKR